MSDRRPRAEVYPWAVLLAFVGLSAWANSLHAPDDWTLRFVAGLVPVSAALCWHLLVRPGLADGWRRALSRGTALAVFGFTMWASFGSLTAIGVRAGLNPPAALAVTLDGLAVVAALSVWAHTPRPTVVTEPATQSTETISTAVTPPPAESPLLPVETVAPITRDTTETRPAPSRSQSRSGGRPAARKGLVETGAAQRAMRTHWDAQRAAGRTPTGAELDRVAGTNNYGRKFAKEWLAEETAVQPVPAGAEA